MEQIIAWILESPIHIGIAAGIAISVAYIAGKIIGKIEKFFHI